MGIFESDHFELGPRQTAPVELGPPASDEVVRGNYWSLHLRGQCHILAFVSGELAGSERQIEVTPDEAAALIAGTSSVERVLRSRRVG